MLANLLLRQGNPIRIGFAVVFLALALALDPVPGLGAETIRSASSTTFLVPLRPHAGNLRWPGEKWRLRKSTTVEASWAEPLK